MGNWLEDKQRHPYELQKELEIRMEDTKKQIKDLKKDIEKAERREIYLKEIHNNYMLQVQTLIKQKQIVALGEKNHGGDSGNIWKASFLNRYFEA